MIYEVWSEGYVCTGDRQGATHHGSVEARSFKEACIKLLEHDNTYNEKANTLWGCRIYDNEKEARQTFG